MASLRWTTGHDELLLSVAGRNGTWPERMQAFTDDLNKRRDFLSMPEPAFTLKEVQDHLKELFKVVPCGPVKSLSTGFYAKRTELLMVIDKNTAGESNAVKTVLFNHAVKEKGWNFVATLQQVEWKLKRLSGNISGQANCPRHSSNTERETQPKTGAKRASTTDSHQTGKRQKVGDDVAKENGEPTKSDTVVEVVDVTINDGAESDLNFFDNGLERESDDSDIEDTSGDGNPKVTVSVQAAAFDSDDIQHEFTSGTARKETETRGEVSLQKNVGVNSHDELTIQVSDIDDQNDVVLDGEETVTAHLRSLVNNKLMSDVTFIVEGTKIFAHKCICVRSNYFKILLSGEYQIARSTAQQVEISDVSREAFLVLLEYVYTDRVNVSGCGVKELFVAADRCGIKSLKRQCSKKLLESLCVDNAAGIMNVAIQHDDPVLREKCFFFVLRNLELVSKTKSFHEMAKSNPEMVVQIVQTVSSLVHIP